MDVTPLVRSPAIVLEQVPTRQPHRVSTPLGEPRDIQARLQAHKASLRPNSWPPKTSTRLVPNLALGQA